MAICAPEKVARSDRVTNGDSFWGRVYTHVPQELIRRWDSERELFYDDTAHVVQNTKKRELTLFNKLDDS